VCFLRGIRFDRFGSSSDPSLNGRLHYPNNIDRSLNEDTDDKIRSEFDRLLFLQTYRETDRFFAVSGVQFPQHDRDQLHFRRVVFVQQLKNRVGLDLDKETVLRITLNLDGSPITSKSHSPITLGNFSCINLVSIIRCSSFPRNPVYVRYVDSSPLGFSLSSHRHSYIGLVFSSPFID
jgi:hypothetical protein